MPAFRYQLGPAALPYFFKLMDFKSKMLPSMQILQIDGRPRQDFDATTPPELVRHSNFEVQSHKLETQRGWRSPRKHWVNLTLRNEGVDYGGGNNGRVNSSHKKQTLKNSL